MKAIEKTLHIWSSHHTCHDTYINAFTSCYRWTCCSWPLLLYKFLRVAYRPPGRGKHHS